MKEINKNAVFIDGAERSYPFHLKGQLFHAEWHSCCGWMFSDWQGDGIFPPSTKLINAFEKAYPHLAEDEYPIDLTE